MNAGGIMNNVWEKFGCNDHDIFLFVFSNSQSAEVLINGYETQGAMVTPKFPVVDKDNGGTEFMKLFADIFGTFGRGRTALIRPDKTFKRILSYSKETSFTNSISYEGCGFYNCDVLCTLTVKNGTGDGVYKKGEDVTIIANTAMQGYKFLKWTGDVANISDVYANSATITIPSQNVTIKATYEAATATVFKEIAFKKGLAILGVNENCLVLNVPINGEYRISMFNPSGKKLLTEKRRLVAGRVSVEFESLLKPNGVCFLSVDGVGFKTKYHCIINK